MKLTYKLLVKDYLSKGKIENLFKENMQLRMWIWIHGDLEKRNKDVVKNILERGDYPHFLVDIVESWELKGNEYKWELICTHNYRLKVFLLNNEAK